MKDEFLLKKVYCNFFIPIEQKVWIEFWGLKETKYLKRKELKKKFYAAHIKNLIELTDKGIGNLDDNMSIKLRKSLIKNMYDFLFFGYY